MDETQNANKQSTPGCCAPKPEVASGCCGNSAKKRFDWLLWGGLGLSIFGYLWYLLLGHTGYLVGAFAHSVFSIANTLWWGVIIGVLAVGLVGKVPQAFVFSLIGQPGTKSGLVRATLAGVLFDLCSHGILMVGAKLYKKGASLGQVMAFLIASPWNSISLTVILVSLIGLSWTLVFLLLSLVIALISGVIFDLLVKGGTLASNPDVYIDDGAVISAGQAYIEVKSGIGKDPLGFLVSAIKDSKTVLKWLFVGIVLAGVINAVIPTEVFATWFGPTLLGTLLTLVAATIIEVCSEGSVPIASDLFNRAGAPGNAFAFMMGGVSTDYTEIMVLKETMGNWKTAFFLPLVTLPQIVVLAILLNNV